jgi:hypothetical protein
MVFSRLEHPERLDSVLGLPPRDNFLSSLEEKSVSPAEAAKVIGLPKL